MTDAAGSGLGPGVEYRLIRSRRRTLSLEIRPDGEVVVRAPLRAPARDVARFVASRRAWLDRHRSAARPGPLVIPTAAQAAMRREAARVVPPLVARYAGMLGLSPAAVRITSALGRLGSCNAKGGVCISWRLMAYPVEIVEYVAAHEAAHLKHLNHSPAFYQTLAGLMPDHRERARTLRRLPHVVPEPAERAGGT